MLPAYSLRRWVRDLLYFVPVCLLLIFCVFSGYLHFTLGEAHGPFAFFGILAGVAAVGLTVIWYGRPIWSRAILFGIPLYVLVVLALAQVRLQRARAAH